MKPQEMIDVIVTRRGFLTGMLADEERRRTNG